MIAGRGTFRFWLEGVILVTIAAVGLVGNVLTGIVLKSFDDRNHPFNNLVSGRDQDRTVVTY